jgi:hypothetical protein
MERSVSVQRLRRVERLQSLLVEKLQQRGEQSRGLFLAQDGIGLTPH